MLSSTKKEIDEKVAQLRQDPSHQADQMQTVAAMVSFFEAMQIGLEGKVGADKLPEVAAVLTAGRWAAPD